MSNIFQLIFITSSIITSSHTQGSFAVLDKVKSGFKLAGAFLKLDQSNGVAKLVSETFKNMTYPKYDQSSADGGIITGFFRILGFNAKKIGAIAINGLIFLAQMLGTSLSIKPPSRLLKARAIKHIDKENQFSWMLENTEVISMISHANDRNLPDQIIEYIKERSVDEETGCIQLLICKTAPFIWGMQKSLTEEHGNNTTRKTANSNGMAMFYQYLPTVDELRDQTDKCTAKYHYCFYDEL